MIYIIHISPHSDPDKRALNRKGNHHLGSREYHYIGFVKCDDRLDERIKEHRSGRGAKILAEATRLGLDWEVVKTYPGDAMDETRLKRHGKDAARRRCPVCNPDCMEQSELWTRKLVKSNLEIWEDYKTTKNKQNLW